MEPDDETGIRSKFSRRTFLKLAGATGLMGALGACGLTPTEADMTPVKIEADVPVDWTKLTREAIDNAVEIVRFPLNEYCKVTLVLSEHGIREADENTSLIEPLLGPGKLLILEYYPPEIQDRIHTNKLAEIHTKADELILPFFTKVMTMGLARNMPMGITDPANFKSFLDINFRFYLNNTPDEFKENTEDDLPKWREKQSLFRNMITAAHLVHIANILGQQQKSLELVLVFPPAHGNQIVDILRQHEQTAVQLDYVYRFLPIEPLNRAETLETRKDQLTARFYAIKNGQYYQEGTLPLF